MKRMQSTNSARGEKPLARAPRYRHNEMQTRAGFPTLGSTDRCLKDRVHLSARYYRSSVRLKTPASTGWVGLEGVRTMSIVESGNGRALKDAKPRCANRLFKGYPSLTITCDPNAKPPFDLVIRNEWKKLRCE